MLPRGGAYSKRYQTEERDRMMQWQSQSARSCRDREHLLSKQTAQRRRALEQKKRAMEQAEEERRRRALEERRQTQREATERCKMAISRLRISTRGSNNHRHQDVPVEILYTSLPRQAGTNRSTASTVSTALLRGMREGGGGRVVLGAQVELRQDQVNSVRRPPALDEVLRSIRGQQSKPPASVPFRPHSVQNRPNKTTATTSDVPSQPPSVQSRQNKTTATTSDVPSRPPSVQSRPTATTSAASSASDPNFNTHCPIYKVHHTKVDQQPPEPSKPKSPTIKSTHTTTTTTSQDTKRHSDTDQGMVFHPVVRGPLKTRVEVSRDTQILRVVSPTQEDSSSSCRSPVDSLSGNSSDAGSTTAPGTKRVVRRHKKIVKKENQKKNGEENSIAAPSNVPKEDAKPSTSSGNKVYSDSSSDDESPPTRLSPPRSRRRRKLPPGQPGETSNKEASVENNEPQGPKIVGILKKPRGGSSTVAFANQTDGREETRAPENVQSCASSTASSALASELTRLRDDAPGAIGRARVSRDTISLSSASTTKRVRFSDNLESSLNCSQASMSHHPPTPSSSSNTTTTDLALERLWRQILQNGSPTNLPLNGMFNPRMKISLNQKGKGCNNHSQKEAQITCDRITVHVPQAKTLPGENDRFSRPSSSVGGGRQTENTGSKDERKEHTQASFSSAQRQRTGVGSSIENATTQGFVETSKGERVRSVETRPTDKEIDRGWGNIQSQLQCCADEEERIPVAPQVFQFSPVPPKIGPPAAGGRGGGGRYLPHRPQQKPTTTRSHTHQKWAGPDKQLHHWPRNMTHPDTVQSEPSYVTVQTSSWEQQQRKQTKSGATGLSHEEQQLMQSLQKINQRLKEHEMAHGPPYYQPASVHTRRRTENLTRHS